MKKLLVILSILAVVLIAAVVAIAFYMQDVATAAVNRARMSPAMNARWPKKENNGADVQTKQQESEEVI